MVILFQHLNFVIEQYRSTSNYLSQKKLNSIQFFCIGLLERLSNSSLALRALLEKIYDNQSLEYACGIILRSTLLDALIVLNLYHIILENEKNENSIEYKEKRIKEFCENILSDGLENTIKYIKAAKDVNIITQEQLIDTYKNFVQNRVSYFEPYANDGSLPIVKCKKAYSPTELFKRIANNPELKELSKIYDSYLFFSKYDHFGILYYEISRHNFNGQLKRIIKGVDLFIFTQSILYVTLRLHSDNNPFLNNQSQIASNYLSEKMLNRQM